MESTFERANEAGNNGSSIRQQRRRVSTDMSALMADVEELVRRVANVGDAEVARVRERVERTLQSVKSATQEGAGTVRGYAREASQVTDEYVRERPWTAVGLAAAVGALIGFLASRR